MTPPVDALPPPPEHFEILDCTLRDGALQESIRLSLGDRLRIAQQVDLLGVDFIEGGWPGLNTIDRDFFEAASQLDLQNSRLVAFGTIAPPGRPVADDPALGALRDVGTDHVCVVVRSDLEHLTAAHLTPPQNLDQLGATVAHLRAEGKQVLVDLEHFFDGYLRDPHYALECVRRVAEAGGRRAVLCDTNGGMLPGQVGDIISAAAAIGVDLGVHCHDDSGCAVANTLAAVEAGAVHVQGAVNGYGPRGGMADTTILLGNLQLKYGWPLVTSEQLAQMTPVATAVAEIAQQVMDPRQPYVGNSSFTWIAARDRPDDPAPEKVSRSHHHVDPVAVGNGERPIDSRGDDRDRLVNKARALGYELVDEELVERILPIFQGREAMGYTYGVADASFELLLRDAMGDLEAPFGVSGWRVLTEHQIGDAEDVTDSHAQLEIVVHHSAGSGQSQTAAGQGAGALAALDDALSGVLVQAYPQVQRFQLLDYQVCILDHVGANSTTRTQVDMSDGVRTWVTIGVGENVIESSWEALNDAYFYGLMKGHGLG
ncbi:alpha-isopropylmalate synthase regulatory domain-containing protein [Luteococcus sp. Sow4_B9]|uniref:alpha-isopropylmalate synthase regulatory domain-containing protein n=1 Tax=Luteococcus sp. Sow4_B9 TaxID=3438792 RepID=UPI003F97A4D5